MENLDEMTNMKAWNLYLKEQQIKLNYFGKGHHRGFETYSKVRCLMNDEELEQNFYRWCENKLRDFL